MDGSSNLEESAEGRALSMTKSQSSRMMDATLALIAVKERLATITEPNEVIHPEDPLSPLVCACDR